MQKLLSLWKTAVILTLVAYSGTAAAQYPSRPIHIVVTYLAGGSADTLARIVARELEGAWKQPVVVENRAGADGDIGAQFVARAAPDGYTLMFTPPAPLAINMLLHKQVPFDPRVAFTPVSVLGRMPNILVVGAHSAVQNVAQLVAAAKANPGNVTYGSQGIGSTPDLTGAMFAVAAGIKIVHVPYRGFPPVLIDLMGSRLDFAFADASNVLPQLKSGQVRPLAVASPHRFFALPNTPTMIEEGFPDFQSATWMSFAAPAGTSAEIVSKWHKELVRIVKMPKVQARFAELGFEAWASSPEEMRQYMDSEITRWSNVVQQSGMQKE